MREKHNAFISLNTLKHRFAKYKLSGNETWRDEEEVKTIIKEEIQGFWVLVALGYKKCGMCLKLSIQLSMCRGICLNKSYMVLIPRQAG